MKLRPASSPPLFFYLLLLLLLLPVGGRSNRRGERVSSAHGIQFDIIRQRTTVHESIVHTLVLMAASAALPIARAVSSTEYSHVGYGKQSSQFDVESQLLLPQDTPTSSDLMGKTYGLISVQLFLTFSVALPMYLNPEFVFNHVTALFWCGFIFMFGFIFALFCTHGIIKLGIALLFSMATGVVVGIGVVAYDVSSIVQAMIITLGITTFCSLFVITTKVSLHSMKGILSTCLWGLILSGIVFMIFPPSGLLEVLYTLFGILVFTGFILVDTSQLIRPYRYSDDEYIDIAVNIYLDIVNLFLRILQLLGKRRN